MGRWFHLHHGSRALNDEQEVLTVLSPVVRIGHFLCGQGQTSLQAA